MLSGLNGGLALTPHQQRHSETYYFLTLTGFWVLTRVSCTQPDCIIDYLPAEHHRRIALQGKTPRYCGMPRAKPGIVPPLLWSTSTRTTRVLPSVLPLREASAALQALQDAGDRRCTTLAKPHCPRGVFEISAPEKSNGCQKHPLGAYYKREILTFR